MNCVLYFQVQRSHKISNNTAKNLYKHHFWQNRGQAYFKQDNTFSLPIGQVIQFVLSADAVTSRWRNDESGFHSLENMCTSRSHTRLL